MFFCNFLFRIFQICDYEIFEITNTIPVGKLSILHIFWNWTSLNMFGVMAFNSESLITFDTGKTVPILAFFINFNFFFIVWWRLFNNLWTSNLWFKSWLGFSRSTSFYNIGKYKFDWRWIWHILFFKFDCFVSLPSYHLGLDFYIWNSLE